MGSVDASSAQEDAIESTERSSREFLENIPDDYGVGDLYNATTPEGPIVSVERPSFVNDISSTDRDEPQHVPQSSAVADVIKCFVLKATTDVAGAAMG
jgi:hypothetical protein